MNKLTLVPIGGLSNRILSISSAIGFCRNNKLELKIIWFRDWGMGAGFHQLLKLSADVENVEVVDATFWDFLYNRPRKWNLWVSYPWQLFAFKKRCYISDFEKMNLESQTKALLSSKSVYLNLCWAFYEWPGMFDSLLPLEDIRQRIGEQTEIFRQQRTVGIHIRRTDMTAFCSKITPLSFFIDRMNLELKSGNTKFFVASDSMEEKQKLKDLFGETVITSFKEVRRDTVEGMKDALTELYLLSMTEKIYGTYCSSYSGLAAKLSGIPLEVI